MEVTKYVNDNASDPRNIKDYPLIKYFLKRSKFLLIDENIDACIEGLAIAYKSFDETKGVFSTYAMKCMYCVMCRKLRDKSTQKRIPKDKLVSIDFTGEFGEYTSLGQKDYREDIENKLLVEEALTVLTKREREIIVQRYLEDKTLEVVGENLNISRQRVAQIEKTALYKMRIFLENK
nr:sigma-70 family RNA polymerase sigma factor [uncultured Cellulosilyticum sp.]